MAPLLTLPRDLVPFLEGYLPPVRRTTGGDNGSSRCFVTLTYAQSLDSRISEAPGVQTVISHPETKTMTHYIRSRHDAILVGIGTVLADDPGLNCRYEGGSAIKPVIVDPGFKLKNVYVGSALQSNHNNKSGLAPIVIVEQRSIDEKSRSFCKENDITLVQLGSTGPFSWTEVFVALSKMGIQSVMVEGGAHVINSLLSSPSTVDSLIVTIGPVFLGASGVQVSPLEGVALKDVTWWKGTRDTVMCSRIAQ